MQDNTKNSFLSKNTLFGLFVGFSWIAVAMIFYTTGKGISANPVLGNIIMLLTIVGAFIGVRKYREESLEGQMTYGQAFGACIYITTVAAICYGVCIYGIYKANPETVKEYLTTINAILKETYKNNSLLENIQTMMDQLMTPGIIAFGEVINKIFTGFIFSLLLAGILRRKKVN